MNDSIEQKRLGFNKVGMNYPLANNVLIEEEEIKKIKCFWFNKKLVAEQKRLLVYVHGGCFALGSIHSHKPLVSHIANKLSLPVLFVEYGLAPEAPYPAGINDIRLVINRICANHPEHKITLIGDSAGCGLIISTFAGLESNLMPSIKSAILISPWIDLNCSSDSFNNKADVDPILSKAGLQRFTQYYIGNTSIHNANPAQKLEHRFPPTLIIVGENEVLLDDAYLAFKNIKKRQDKTHLSVYDDQTHVFPLDKIDTAQSKSVLIEIQKFMNDL